MTCQHQFTRYVGDITHKGVECLVVRCGKCAQDINVPVYANDRRHCRVCGNLLYGKEDCDSPHCQAESKRKNPCKFKRLRNA